MILKLPLANSGVRPIAVKTCDGSSETEEQALPLEADIPARSSPSRMGSPSTSSKEKLALFDNLEVGWPFKCDFGIRLVTLSII